MGWFFSNKKEVEKVKEETRSGFERVKNDIDNVSKWIKHLDSEKNIQKNDISELKEDLSTIMDDIENIKNMISIIGSVKNGQLSKTPSKVSNKHTPVYAVQTGVETGVETPDLSQFSITERAIIWVLLNTDMKLSYEDLAAMLGKEKSTLRSQINLIKQKSEVIEEIIEKNGKKRVFIPEEIKEKMLKKSKVRVSNAKNSKKSKKSISEY